MSLSVSRLSHDTGFEATTEDVTGSMEGIPAKKAKYTQMFEIKPRGNLRNDFRRGIIKSGHSKLREQI